MRNRKVNNRTLGNHSGRVDGLMAFVVMPFNMLHIDCLSDAGLLVQIAQVFRKVGIIGNAPDITLKMTYVDRIKPDQRGEQTPIRFSDLIARQIPL